MGKIFVGQTALNIRLKTGISLATSKAWAIKYRKPTGATGSWVAVVYDSPTGVIQYTIGSASDLDVVGTWAMWSHVTFNDNTVAAGEAVAIPVYAEGT